jgi:glycerol-3-phosphate dehydrogenase
MAPRPPRVRLPAPDTTFDVLVIGGGITGAGVARDAALRGLRVLMVEKDDFASGTSSRSSRLIHGGLRYLEHGQLHLVLESTAERRRLLRLAPHLVHPLRFVWPVYEHARVPLWKVRAGVTLYDALALFRGDAHHRSLDARGVTTLEPALASAGLRGGVLYFDAATDDVRLTLANVLDAERLGAVVLNHVAVTAFAVDRGAVSGARLVDHLTGETRDVRARTLVNATGPWSDDVRGLEGGSREARVRGSKGAHILVPRARVGNVEALTLLAPADGRVMFALPAGDFAVLGTTDTFTSEHPDEVRASAADVSYLLNAANTFFPAAHLTRADVVSAWAGIRPLRATGTSSPDAASRDHAVEITPGGVVTVTGGKLTTYRIMAAQVVDAVEDQLGRRTTCRTGSIPLTNDAALRDAECARDARSREPVSASLPYRFGELRWAVEHEHARTLGDLLIRRTRVAFESADHGLGVAAAAAEYVAPILAWDAAAMIDAVARYDEDIRRIFTID